MSEPLTIGWLREKWTDPENERTVLRDIQRLAGWLVGTRNGWVMMLLPNDDADANPLNGWEFAPDVLAPEFCADTTVANLHAWAGGPAREPVEVTKGCPACGGRKRVTCECECGHRHEADCYKCKGVGTIVETDEERYRLGMFFGVLVNRIRLQEAIVDLPGGPVRVAVKPGVFPVVLDGNGWRVALMPLRAESFAGASNVARFPAQEASDAA